MVFLSQEGDGTNTVHITNLKEPNLGDSPCDARAHDLDGDLEHDTPCTGGPVPARTLNLM